MLNNARCPAMHTACIAAFVQAFALKPAMLLSLVLEKHQPGMMFHAQDIDFSK